MGATESSINWFDVIYQIGFLAFLVAVAFLYTNSSKILENE
ncbi:hypothetical protein ACQKML_12915 [Peribacillus frigoritolerans]